MCMRRRLSDARRGERRAIPVDLTERAEKTSINENWSHPWGGQCAVRSISIDRSTAADVSM